jgi:hypothetical protein
MDEKKTYIVLTSGDEPLDNISRELKKNGFSIDSTLDAIGQIVAKGNEQQKKKALKIKGIKSIHLSHDDIDIGPPDAGSTW